MLEYYYGYKGGQTQEQVGTGSGVIISADGYIVTNNHVIKDASEIEITLNNKQSKSKTHRYRFENGYRFAKIDANETLPYTTFGNLIL
jgi:S1-C subfamily serine protease